MTARLRHGQPYQSFMFRDYYEARWERYITLDAHFTPEAHGEIFPYLSNPSPYMPDGEGLGISGAEIPADAGLGTYGQTFARLLSPVHDGCIQIIGGASGLPLQDIPVMDDLLGGIDRKRELPAVFSLARNIYRAAAQVNATIVTGGTQSGIMGVLSSIWLADKIFNQKISTLVGKRQDLLQMYKDLEYNSIRRPALYHIVAQAQTSYPTNKHADAQNAWPLAPCDAFLSLSGGGGWQAEGDALDLSPYVTNFLPGFELAVAAVRDYSCVDYERIGIIVNGGYFSLLETSNAVMSPTPASLLIIEGSGRFSDLLAASVKNGYEVPTDDHPVWTIPKVHSDYNSPRTPNYKSRLDTLLGQLKQFDQEGNMKAHVHSLNDEGLTSKIRSIMTGEPR